MRGNRVSGRELTDLRGLLARLTFETRLLRYGRHLARKDWSDQPRAPAGQSEGGQWVAGGGGAPREDPVTTGSIVTDDGSHVLSIRIRARPRPFDEQHFVTAPDGESRIFETSDATQTIRDGETGEVLAKSTFTERGAEPEAWVQSALLRTLAPAATVVTRTLEAAASLFAALSAGNNRNATTALGLTATQFLPDDGPNFSTAWVGQLSREELDAACPRAGDVQTMADVAAATVRSQVEGLSPQAFGNRVHFLIKQEVDSEKNPNFVAELSLDRSRARVAEYGEANTYRLDVLERLEGGTVCVYDHKTGVSGLSVRRAHELASVVSRNFPDAIRIVVIEVRPQN